MPYYVKIARHYEEARKHEEAERYSVAADMPKHAVNTYASAGKWDAAHRVAAPLSRSSRSRSWFFSILQQRAGTRLAPCGRPP